jgi:hypothetical protein
MPNYYSEKSYEGPETIVVAMDIGTTHSEQGLSDESGADLLFQVQYRSPTSLQAINLRGKWYCNVIITPFHLTID